MRWFKFHADLNDPTLQRLPGEKFKTWINLLCITSKNDGVLPPLTDLTFLLRPMVEDKIAASMLTVRRRNARSGTVTGSVASRVTAVTVTAASRL